MTSYVYSCIARLSRPLTGQFSMPRNSSDPPQFARGEHPATTGRIDEMSATRPASETREVLDRCAPANSRSHRSWPHCARRPRSSPSSSRSPARWRCWAPSRWGCWPTGTGFARSIAATVAAGLIAFLIAGLGGLMTVVHSAYIGGLTGIVKRRRRGTRTVLVVSFIAGAVFGAVCGCRIGGALAAAAPDLRGHHRQRRWDCGRLDGDRALRDRTSIPVQHAHRARARDGRRRTPVVPRRGAALLAVADLRQRHRLAHGRVLDRLVGAVARAGADARHPRRAQTGRAARRSRRLRPVPVRLDQVRFRYPNADHDALRPVSLDVRAGEHLAITGANGSGKTTLMLVLAGREPTSGTIERPGAVGLGRLGGTAVVMQHPESQVLGTRVADDVVWGLPPGTASRRRSVARRGRPRRARRTRHRQSVGR